MSNGDDRAVGEAISAFGQLNVFNFKNSLVGIKLHVTTSLVL